MGFPSWVGSLATSIDASDQLDYNLPLEDKTLYLFIWSLNRRGAEAQRSSIASAPRTLCGGALGVNCFPEKSIRIFSWADA